MNWKIRNPNRVLPLPTPSRLNGKNLICIKELEDMRLKPLLDACKDYCMCDIKKVSPTSDKLQSSQANESVIFISDDSEEMKNCGSKNQMNLILLKSYEYETATRFDSKGVLQTLYICKFKECNKVFKRTWNLLDHARVHKSVKPYKCSYCWRSYTQKGNLQKHLKQHLTPDIKSRKQFTCEFCSRMYTEKYNMKAHQQKFHRAELMRRQRSNNSD